MTKIAGHPESRTSQLASKPPVAKPIGTPVDIRITSRAGLTPGSESEASATASGMPPPRPSPVRKRKSANSDGERATLESREKAANSMTQTIKPRFGSAAIPQPSGAKRTDHQPDIRGCQHHRESELRRSEASTRDE